MLNESGWTVRLADERLCDINTFGFCLTHMIESMLMNMSLKNTIIQLEYADLYEVGELH